MTVTYKHIPFAGTGIDYPACAIVWKTLQAARLEPRKLSTLPAPEQLAQIGFDAYHRQRWHDENQGH